MKLKLAVVFSALFGVGLLAASSPSFAQLGERIKELRRQSEQKAAPQPEPKADQASQPRSVGKKGKGKGKAYAKGQNK